MGFFPLPGALKTTRGQRTVLLKREGFLPYTQTKKVPTRRLDNPMRFTIPALQPEVSDSETTP